MTITLQCLKQCHALVSLPVRLIAAIVCISALLTGCKTTSRTTTPALKTQNVFLITTDGLRWQEVFAGADELLLTNATLNANPDRMQQLFGKPTTEARRRYLMPFVWSRIAVSGQLYGNQDKGSEARVTNGKNFSYPGYNEFLTGSPDPRIDSNAAKPNPNTNVLEWLNEQPRFHGKVAASVNWKSIPWILNTPRSQLPVWNSFLTPPGAPVVSSPEILRDLSIDMTPVFTYITFDAFPFHAALDYLDKHQPRVFYVAFNETDEWAHEGKYDRYLVATRRVDRFIADLWAYCQSTPQYRDKTTFIITTDHGRGSGPEEWKSHSKTIAGSENTWIAVIGPDTPPLGERENCAPVTAGQVAATIAAFLGEDYSKSNPQTAPSLAEAIVPGAGLTKPLSHENHP